MISKILNGEYINRFGYLLERQIIRFAICGVLLAFIDFSIYATLLFIGVNLSLSKAFSYIVCIIVAYFLNKNWTFNIAKSNYRTFILFVLSYGLSLIININVNSQVVSVSHGYLEDKIAIVLAFFAATGGAATFNFINLKFFIFKERS